MRRRCVTAYVCSLGCQCFPLGGWRRACNLHTAVRRCVAAVNRLTHTWRYRLPGRTWRIAGGGGGGCRQQVGGAWRSGVPGSPSAGAPRSPSAHGGKRGRPGMGTRGADSLPRRRSAPVGLYSGDIKCKFPSHFLSLAYTNRLLPWRAARVPSLPGPLRPASRRGGGGGPRLLRVPRGRRGQMQGGVRRGGGEEQGRGRGQVLQQLLLLLVDWTEIQSW